MTTISKSSMRKLRVAAAKAKSGKGMTSAQRSAAAKKGWETRRRKGFKAKGTESMADRAARGGPSVGDQMAAGPMERKRKTSGRTGRKPLPVRQLHGRPITDKSVVRTSGRKPGGVTQEKAVQQLGSKSGSAAIRRAAVKRAVDSGKGRANTRAERVKALRTSASRDGRVTAARHGKERRKKSAQQSAESQVRVALKFNGDDPGRAIADLRLELRDLKASKTRMGAERRDARGSSDYGDMPTQRSYDARIKEINTAIKMLKERKK